MTRLADDDRIHYSTDFSQRPKSRAHELTRIEFVYDRGSNLPTFIVRSDHDLITELEQDFDGEFIESNVLVISINK